MLRGLIDIKKHTGSTKCALYDVTVYEDLKVYPYRGRLYPKLKFEEVRVLLSQGNFKPTSLSQTLFEKILQ
ncbi:hypothetical protein ACRPK2_09270 [Lactococcus garvieae]|uniref:hypothetical protein n=1 Tax=Lactococcus garvieae TaxID=1363 RepID=UPI003D7807DB